MLWTKFYECWSSNYFSNTATAEGNESKFKQTFNISHVPSFKNYDLKKEIFKYFIDCFENYLTMKDIFQDRNRSGQMLLNFVGATEL